MNIQKIIIAISLGIAVSCMMASCNFSKEDMKRIVRKEAGKDDYRDSEKWGKVITQPIALEDFTHIELAGNADIKFRQGETLSVEAYGNEKAIESNDIKVVDGTLTVSKKSEVEEKLPSIKLIITAPTLESIHVAGVGDIEMKDTIEFASDFSIHVAGAGDVDIDRLKCQNFSLQISGAGDITAEKIKSKKADVQISGAGDLKADIKASDIHVQISGAGDADLDVKCQNLKVMASGTGEVELKGECAHLTKQSGGMASIDSRKLTIHEGIVIQ